MRGLVPGIAIGLGLAGAVSAQEPVLPSEQQVALVEACAAAAFSEGRDLAVCRGVLAGPCLGERGGDDADVMDRAICLQFEEFAWKLTGMKAETYYLSVMEGREGFSRDDYLADAEADLAQLRDRCFRFPAGQEISVLSCTLDGAVLKVAQTLRLIETATP